MGGGGSRERGLKEWEKGNVHSDIKKQPHDLRGLQANCCLSRGGLRIRGVSYYILNYAVPKGTLLCPVPIEEVLARSVQAELNHLASRMAPLPDLCPVCTLRTRMPSLSRTGPCKMPKRVFVPFLPMSHWAHRGHAVVAVGAELTVAIGARGRIELLPSPPLPFFALTRTHFSQSFAQYAGSNLNGT